MRNAFRPILLSALAVAAQLPFVFGGQATALGGNVRYNVVPVDLDDGVRSEIRVVHNQGSEPPIEVMALGKARISGGFVETDGTFGLIDACNIVDYLFAIDYVTSDPTIHRFEIRPDYFECAEFGFGFSSIDLMIGSFHATPTTLSLPLDTDPEIQDSDSWAENDMVVGPRRISVACLGCDYHQLNYTNLLNDFGESSLEISFQLFEEVLPPNFWENEAQDWHIHNDSWKTTFDSQSRFVVATVPEPSASTLLVIAALLAAYSTTRHKRL